MTSRRQDGPSRHVQALPVGGPTRGSVSDLGCREIDDGPAGDRVEVELRIGSHRGDEIPLRRDRDAGDLDTFPADGRGFATLDRLDVETRALSREPAGKHETLAIRKEGAERSLEKVTGRDRARLSRTDWHEDELGCRPRQRPLAVGGQVDPDPVAEPQSRRPIGPSKINREVRASSLSGLVEENQASVARESAVALPVEPAEIAGRLGSGQKGQGPPR